MSRTFKDVSMINQKKKARARGFVRQPRRRAYEKLFVSCPNTYSAVMFGPFDAKTRYQIEKNGLELKEIVKSGKKSIDEFTDGDIQAFSRCAELMAGLTHIMISPDGRTVVSPRVNISPAGSPEKTIDLLLGRRTFAGRKIVSCDLVSVNVTIDHRMFETNDNGVICHVEDKIKNYEVMSNDDPTLGMFVTVEFRWKADIETETYELEGDPVRAGLRPPYWEYHHRCYLCDGYPREYRQDVRRRLRNVQQIDEFDEFDDLEKMISPRRIGRIWA